MLPFEADDAGYHRGELFDVTVRCRYSPGTQTWLSMRLWDILKEKGPFTLIFVQIGGDPDKEQYRARWCDILELVPVVSEKKGFWK